MGGKTYKVRQNRKGRQVCIFTQETFFLQGILNDTIE